MTEKTQAIMDKSLDARENEEEISVPAKPVVNGPVDGNIFGVMGVCSKALKRAGLKDQA